MIASGPPYLYFLPSRKCSARCRVCYVRHETAADHGARQPDALPHFSSPTMPTGDLDSKLAGRILDAYPSVIGVDISSLGETLEYSMFDALIEEIAGRMPRILGVGVTTNGRLLDAHPRLLELPGWLTISVDSPDPATCDILRPGTDGQRVWRNISAVARGPRHPNRCININMVVSRRNAHEIRSMIDRLAFLGISDVQIVRAVHLTGEEAEYELPVAAQEVVTAILGARRAYPKMSIGDLVTVGDGGFPMANPSDGGFCQTPFNSLLVDAVGHARPCCRIQGLDLGDMLISDPWHSPMMESLRRQAKARKFDSPDFAACTVCHGRYGPGTKQLGR